jgi:hypothetical protein
MIDLTDYNQCLVDLAQKWRTGQITEPEYQELDSWFRSLEAIPLGPPVEMAVEKLEKRLHEQLYKNVIPPEMEDDFNASQLFVK